MDCGEGMKMEVSPEEVLLGVKKEDNPDRYKTLSPISYLDADDVPFIVFHGTVDNVVPFCQGEIFTRALQDKGVKHEFYPVEGGGHGFNMYTEENLTRMVTFLNNAREAQK
jgi:dipeptidyl aminopeptidase/acylaminoacyl peptidase